MSVQSTETEFERILCLNLEEHSGWAQRQPKDYDKELALVPDDVIGYVQDTQPDTWRLLEHHYGPGVREHVLKRLRKQLREKGTLTTLRDGFKMAPGVDVRICGFAPDGFATSDTLRLYTGNRMSTIRQVVYKVKGGDKIDVVMFINGVPVVTMELKNSGSSSTYKDAIEQYKTTRSPVGSPLLRHDEGALVHLAMDQHEVWMTTRLTGASTHFIPFNRGRPSEKVPGEVGAGNPPVRIGDKREFDVAYLYRSLSGEPAVFSKETLLTIIGRFCAADEKGTLIWPRYHQLCGVRNLVRHAERHGAGHNYLMQHSAGSGKSNTIAWSAHNLAFLHDAAGKPVFDAVIVLTDRKVLDKQIKRVVKRFTASPGYVKEINGTSRELRAALGSGAKIILTTIQKFSTETMDGLRNDEGRRFMVLIDEAHSSQSGKHADAMMNSLGHGEDEDAERDRVEALLAERQNNRRPPNVSCAAFTATPKAVTLERFGTDTDKGKRPFHAYSMRQAIEEGFIKDVLQNYHTYTAYYDLVKAVDEDPRLKSGQTHKRLVEMALRSDVALDEKVRVICEHFITHALPELGAHTSKAMVVCEGRANAVRMMRAIQEHALANDLRNVRPVVAFSDTIVVGGDEETETSINGFPASEIERRMDETAPTSPNILVVADKFQTGYDQPKLVAMYVDRSLNGLQAVQTLSRLNRTHPRKETSYVLDFVNDPEDIRKAFMPYYDQAKMSGTTDLNQVYDLADKLMGFGVLFKEEVERFARTCLAPEDINTARPLLDGIMTDVMRRLDEETEGRQQEFSELVISFTRFYAFVSQMVPMRDMDMERLYVFAVWLRKRMPTREGGGHDVLVDGMVDVLRYRLRDGGNHDLRIGRGEGGELDPITEFGANSRNDETARLSEIVALINERYGDVGTDGFNNFLTECWEEMLMDEDLATRVSTNPPDVMVDDVISGFQRQAVKKRDRDNAMTTIIIKDKDVQAMIARMFLRGLPTL